MSVSVILKSRNTERAPTGWRTALALKRGLVSTAFALTTGSSKAHKVERMSPTDTAIPHTSKRDTFRIMPLARSQTMTATLTVTVLIKAMVRE